MKGLLVTCVLVASAAVHAASVSVVGGNVLLRQDDGGETKRLTSSGLDLEASLSPDGKTVAFVRHTPATSVETALGDEEAREIWTVAADGTGAGRRLRGRARAKPEATLAAFEQPRFSPDGQLVYFLSSAWVTSAAVHALDLRTGAVRFVCAGNSLEVIQHGRYAGHLVVGQHRYFLAGGSYDWLWLVAPDGRAVGPVGEDDEAVAGFRRLYGG